MAPSFLQSENYARGLDRIRSWFNNKNFVAKRFRGVLLGMTVNASIGEVCAYTLIKQDINAGHLPIHTAVMKKRLERKRCMISWWGFRNRRALLISYTTIVTVAILSWFMIPTSSKREESEFCDAANTYNNSTFLGVPPTTVARLVIVLISSITFVVSRVAIWSHGIAYSDEFAPQRTSMHLGILIIGRALPLVHGHRVLTETVENALAVQTTFLLVGYMANLLQLFLVVPKTVPQVDGLQKMALPFEGRKFLQSVGRVCRNSLAMKQILAMGLLAAALYGYLYNEIDIIKVKYNLIPEISGMVNFTELVLYHYLVVAVVLAGALFSAPILMEFRKGDAIMQVIKTTLIAFILFLIITFKLQCDHGKVVGLENGYYQKPECSISCGCKARMQEFEPVCVVDSMLTYVSPCQAGCAGSEFLNGVKAYTNCTCSSTGRALVGACTDTACKQSYRLQNMMFCAIITFTLLAFQGQGVLLLRAVDPRDKSVAMGMMWSVMAAITFIFGHLIFLGIRVFNCRWFEAGQCQLQNAKLPYLIGGTSAALILLSLLISLASAFSIRAANERKEYIEDTEL